jgi:hypothetical protein
MGIRVTAYTIEVGTTQTLEMTAGEDREFQLAFTLGGLPLDMTSTNTVKMTVRNRANGILVVARTYTAFQGAASAGIPRFQLLRSDTVSQSNPAVYDVDVQWTDGSGYEWELLATSNFNLLKKTFSDGDQATSPPGVPVAFGYAALRTCYGTIPQYGLYKESPTGAAGSVALWLHTDDPSLYTGVAMATGTSGQVIQGVQVPGFSTQMLSDGTTAFNPGDPTEPSPTVDGCIRKAASKAVTGSAQAQVPTGLNQLVTVQWRR